MKVQSFEEVNWFKISIKTKKLYWSSDRTAVALVILLQMTRIKRIKRNESGSHAPSTYRTVGYRSFKSNGQISNKTNRRDRKRKRIAPSRNCSLFISPNGQNSIEVSASQCFSIGV